MNTINVTFETMPRAIEQLFTELQAIKAKLAAPAPSKPINDRMLLDETLEFLREQGRPTSKSTLYKETCLNAIPHERIGKRLVFSREALRTWIEQGMPNVADLEAADRLQKSVK